MSNEPVNKIAARISLDMTPMKQDLLEGSEAVRQFNQSLMQTSSAAVQQMNSRLYASAEELQARLKQIQLDGSSARLMQWTEYYRQSENEQALFQQKYLQNEMLFQERLNQMQNRGAISAGVHSYGSSGLNISAGEMAKDMLMWGTFSTVFDNIKQGLVDVGTSAAGLQQVFGEDIKSQQDLNQVTDAFISIAERYGENVNQVIAAGKLWGRQYSEQISEVLTANSTLLSIVDNLDVTQANQSVESSMQAMGLQINNVNDAMTNSMRLIDSWTAVSHNLSVNTDQLAQGFERSAASAKLVGLNIDQLTALVASGVRNTGRSGSVIGNSLKSVMDNIVSQSPKAVEALKELGVSLYETGANGEKQMRPIWNVLLDISKAMQTANASQTKLFSDLAGGKQQFDNFVATISNTKTLMDAYNVSVNSAGETQKLATAQMHTLAAELQRLQDSIQKMAYDASSGGLGDVLKGLVVDITNLINGLQQLPSWVDWTGAAFLGLLMTGKMVSGVMNSFGSITKMVSSGLQFWGDAAGAAASSAVALAGATTSATADLNAKVIATHADAVANEEETTSALGAAEAIGVEGRAAATAATEVGILDAATAGVTLGLSVLIPIIAGVTMHLGSQAKAAQDAAQSMQDLEEQGQANSDKVIQQVNQLQDLKTAYEQAAKALDTAKQGSDAAKKAESELMDIRSQMIGLIGQEKTDEILKSKDVVQAINDEVQKMLDANVQELQAINDRLKNEKLLTDGFIQQSNNRISQLQTEMDAIQNAAQMREGYRGQFAADMQSIHPLNPKPSTAEQANIDSLSQQQEDTWRRSLGYQNYLNSHGQFDDQVAAAKAKADAHRNNPDQTFGTTSNSSGGIVPSTGSKSGGSNPMQTYLDRFSNLSKNDDMVLQYYEDRVNNASYALDRMNQMFSTANDNLKSHATDTKAASDAVKAYNDDIKALNDHSNALAGENRQLNQSIDGVNEKLAQVKSDYKSGKIGSDTYKQATYDLGQELDRLTQKLNDNTQAIQKDKDAIKQATADVTSTIINMLQTAYQDQQKVQEDSLKKMFDDKIAALQSEKDSIDASIQQLQDMWNQQDEQNKLTDLQNQLAGVMADKRYQIVNADGSVTWTYDTSKAQQIQQEIADQQTKINRNAQLKQLQDQSNSLATQIKNLQDTYNTEKQQLDDYWAYKLRTDNLQSQADNLVLEDGLKGALKLVQTYANPIISKYNDIASAAAQAGAVLAGSLGGGGIPMGQVISSGVTSGSSKIAPNDQPYVIWSDRDRKYYYGNNFHDTEMAAGGYWQDGKWIKANKGGLIPKSLGTPGVDSVPALLTPGELVISAPQVEDVMRNFTKSPSAPAQIVYQFQGASFSFPGVRNVQDMAEFLEGLTEKVGIVRV